MTWEWAGNIMTPVLWLLTSFIVLTLAIAVDRVLKVRRRAALRSARIWFEYSQMAAQRAEEMRGR